MAIKHHTLITLLLILFVVPDIYSQSLPIGEIQEEQFKLRILLNDSLQTKTVNRPLSLQSYQSAFQYSESTNISTWQDRPLVGFQFNLPPGLKIGLHPFTVRNTFNTRLPNSENNGAAWYGRGYTTEISGGLYLTSKYFTISFLPYLIYHQNSDFLHPRFIPTDSRGNIRYVSEGNLGLDAPFRFGPDPFSVFDLGYSSARIHYKQFEAGVSTEPLWWGPAVRYPLIMSNNAPGIPHAFLNLREPLRIPYIGNIQFRWIIGYPEESDYYDGDGAGETRFSNAVNASYSPSFLKQLTVGLIRLYHLYELNGFDLDNVFRIFDPFSRERLVRTQGGDLVRQSRNQVASFYVHLYLPEARAEIYGEFYREDHSYDFRDLVNQPHHNSAYLFGFQKISNIAWFDFMKTNFEITNITNNQLKQVRIQSSFYTHSRIRQGHTHRGKIMGAAIGPGSNSQYISFDGYKDNYKIGFFAQRIVDNDSFHFARGSASIAPSPNFGDYFRHRVDLNFGLNFLYGPGPFYLQSRLVWTKAYNYGRFDYDNFRGINLTNYERNDRTNVQFQIGITYIL